MKRRNSETEHQDNGMYTGLMGKVQLVTFSENGTFQFLMCFPCLDSSSAFGDVDFTFHTSTSGNKVSTTTEIKWQRMKFTLFSSMKLKKVELEVLFE